MKLLEIDISEITKDVLTEEVIEKFTKGFLEGALKFIAALAIIIIGFQIIKVLCRKVNEAKLTKKIDSSLASFLNSFMNIGLKVLLIVIAISILGVPMATIVTVIGTAGLAIGLALQGSLSNFAGGFIIIAFKPFSVGDFIEVGDYSGTVKEIGMFYTTLVTLDNRQVSLPNSVVSNKELVNCSTQGTRMVDLKFGVAYSSDFDAVRETLKAVAKDSDLTLKEYEPNVFVSEYADSAIVFTLRFWCMAANYLPVQADIKNRVKAAFDENGISFPFPQMDVHLDNKG
jgi:small conductance mechanosensitive channel